MNQVMDVEDNITKPTPSACRSFIQTLVVALLLSHLSPTGKAMVLKSDHVKAQWDTWAYQYKGAYYLYYLITERSAGEGFGVATSKDGVHWKDHGWALRESHRNSSYLGTGAVWKSVDFEDTGRFICNYSEHRKDAQGRNIQNILFAWSTDLIHWTKYDDDTMFKIDAEHYSPYGRWDCIFAFPRAEGGYWGTWTATGKEKKGIVGIGYSEDGLKWKALPPSEVNPPVSESGAIYPVNGRYYGMFGAGRSMRSYWADAATGPYRQPAKNAVFLQRGPTYFSRFLPTEDGLLVNHHSLTGKQLEHRSRRPITYVAPFKRATVDGEGVMRWKYWKGNEAIKGTTVPFHPGKVGDIQMHEEELDFNTGIVIEGDVTLPQAGGKPVTMFFVVGRRWYAMRILEKGVVEMGTTDSSGGNWKKVFGVDREWDFGKTAPLRVLARAGMMEVYLDDHFMECWTMGCHGAKTVSIGCEDDSRLQNIKVWQMSLEPAKTPEVVEPLRAAATASSIYDSRYVHGSDINALGQELSKEVLLDFVNTRYQAYFHYNLCTFKNLTTDQPQNRTFGKDPATMWNPTGLDCEQWARVCIESKMAGGWLTTKHHGGFCLWDSQHTDYDVASSHVTTDVVKAFTDAFRKAGLKIGLYYSILDYHHGGENGSVTQEEIEFLKAQITELLTNYGPIDYMNFDGWSTWPTTPTFDDIAYAELFKTVKALQPNCLIVNHTYESNLAHADVPFADAAGRAYPFHPDYMRPTAASDVLQTGWWWDDNKDYGVRRSVDYVLKQLDSYNSHNSVYVLNISPNTAGRLPEDAVQRLSEVAQVWDRPADLKAAGTNWGYQYDVRRNLAFMRPATQSSTHPFIRDKRAYPRAEIALDGVIEGNGDMEQTSMTNVEKQPWWQVDLERDCRVDQITIYNRTDAAKDNLKQFWIMIMDNRGNIVWKHYREACSNPSVTLKADAVIGRSVKIQLDGDESLNIAEVIVEGEAL